MKRMNPAEWAICHRQIIYFFIVAIIIGGILSFFRLGRSEDPNFVIRQMVVTAAWPGASAQQITNQVTDPIEKRLQDTKDLDFVKSFTHDGRTVIYVRLKDHTPKEEVSTRWHDVRNIVNDMSRSLPQGVQGPFFNDRFDDVYGSIYAITGDDYSYEEKRKYAEQLRGRLLCVPDVQRIDLVGVQKQMIYVEMDSHKLASLGMNPETIFRLLKQQGSIAPAGIIQTENKNIAIRVEGLLDSTTALENIPLHVGERSFRLGDVATVRQTYEEPHSPTMYFNGKPAVGVAISMRDGGDNLALGKNMAKEIEALKEDLPVGLDISLVANQPEVVHQAINRFTQSLLEAICIVMLASFLSLGLRSGVVLAMCIPVVVCSSFLFMEYKGIDLHIVSLGSLIVALGLLVDDAIIVIEMMQVKLEHGAGRMEAAESAYNTCAMPMLAGTLVTTAGFIPVALSNGMTAEYTNALFWVIASTLILSWIASIFISPVLGYQFIKVGKSLRWKQVVHQKSYAFFYKAIRKALHYRKAVVIGTISLFAFSLSLYPAINKEFFPPSVRPELILDFDLPAGSSLSETEQVMAGLADSLSGDKKVSSFSSYVGQTAPRFILLVNPEAPKDHHGQMIIVATDTESRNQLKAQLLDTIDDQYPDIQAHVRFIATGPPAEYPIMLRLQGTDPATTIKLAEEAKNLMKENSHVTSVTSDWPEYTPMVKLSINQDKIRQLGIDNYAVAQDLYVKLSGVKVSESYQGDQLVPISFKLEGDNAARLATLSSLPIHVGGGRYVPLGDFADISYKNEINTIWRRNGMPCITLRGEPVGEMTSDSVEADIYDKTLKEFRENLPSGYTLEKDGALEQSDISLKAIIRPLPIMIFIILMILMFELKKIPLMMMAAISGPLGIIGCLLTLTITRQPIGFVAIVGMIAIMGMVVRNSVILIDQIRQHLEEGMTPYKAIIDSAVIRFRPIMLTSFAEVLGMIPLLPNPFWSPMSVSFIGGLALATPLGLLFVPALYAWWYDVKETDEKGTWEK